MSGKESPEARAERLTAELRAATSEAAGMLKDAKAMIKQVREMLPAEVDTMMVERIQPVMGDHVGVITQIIQAVETEMVARFNRTQKQLSDLMHAFLETGHIIEITDVTYERVKKVDDLLERLHKQV